MVKHYYHILLGTVLHWLMFACLGDKILKQIFRLMMLVALMIVGIGCGAKNVTLPMSQNASNAEETGTLIIRLSGLSAVDRRGSALS